MKSKEFIIRYVIQLCTVTFVGGQFFPINFIKYISGLNFKSRIT